MFLTAQVAISVIILTLTTQFAIDSAMKASRNYLGSSVGVYLLAVKGSMESVISSNFLALARGQIVMRSTGVPLFADQAKPTIAELVAQGHLPSTFPATAPGNLQVAIELRRSAATCPGVGCRIEALVYTTTPMLQADSTNPDYNMVAAAVTEMKGFGGASWEDAPDKFRGGEFNVDNPITDASRRAGLVATVAMLDTSMWNQFVRVGDDRDPSLQGNLSVNGAATVQRLGIRDLVVPNTACTPTSLVNAATPALQPVSLADNVEYARTTTGGIATCVNGSWRSVAVIAALGGPCGSAAYPEGSSAIDVSGTALLCRDATWSSLSQWLSRTVRMSTYLVPTTLVASATSTTLPKPACGSSGGVPGTPRVEVVPQSIQNRGSFSLTGVRSGDNIIVNGTMTLDPTNFPATNSGANWMVGVPANSQAIVQTYCVYS